MLFAQRYISNELTHFVGRALPDNDARYQLLLTILKDGVLGAGFGRGAFLGWSLNIKSKLALSSNNKYQGSYVCFADIPVGDLAIHVNKYGPFGLSFPKPFLLKCGVSPVFYVAGGARTLVFRHQVDAPKNRKITGPMKVLSPAESLARPDGMYMSFAELFDESERQLARQHALPGGDAAEERNELNENLWEFLNLYLFPYIKFFDPLLSDGHPDNFYMEREWRTTNIVPFQHSDVERILLPRSYADRFRGDVPSYTGQLVFTDSL